LRGLAGFVQHLHRRFIHLHDVIGQQPIAQQVDQGLDQLACLDHPVRQRRARDIHADALQDLFLSVQGQCVLILRDTDVRQQSGGSQALGNGLRGQGRGLDAAAAVAGVGLADMPQYADLDKQKRGPGTNRNGKRNGDRFIFSGKRGKRGQIYFLNSIE